MSDRAPYSRIYWSVLSDDKFVGIRSDMRHFGSWSLLLMVADMAWPSPAFIPPVVPKASLAKLVEVGLVDVVEAGMYRIHGLDSERGRRATAAKRDPVGSQLGSQSGPKRDPVGSLDRDIDETETRTSRAETPRDAADVYWQLTGKYPAGRALDWIDNLASTYGAEPTIAALAKTYASNHAVNDLLSRTQDALRADARKLDLRDREAEKARLAEKRAQPRVEEAWRAEFREAIQRQYGEDAA